MNKQRRRMIEVVCSDLKKVLSMLDDIRMEEEFAFDSMPENLQCSMRGEESEEAIDVMSDASDSLQEIIDNLSELTL